MCSHCGRCIPGSFRTHHPRLKHLFHKMPKVDHQGGAAPGITDSSHAFTTISAVSRSFWSCQTLLFCLQYTLHQSLTARDEADTPLFNSPCLHHLRPEGSLLVCNRLMAKLSLLTASVSFHGKPTDSGLGHVTDFDPEDNDRLGVSKCLQEHAWNRLLEEET